jgi:hypothetical protein
VLRGIPQSEKSVLPGKEQGAMTSQTPDKKVQATEHKEQVYTSMLNNIDNSHGQILLSEFVGF